MKRKFFVGALLAVLAAAVLLVSCPAEGGGGRRDVYWPAASVYPFFTLHPTSRVYATGTEEFTELVVEISERSRNGREVVWQWYRANTFSNIVALGTQIPYATEPTFTPDAAGFYFVTATVDGRTRASNPVHIRVGAPVTVDGTLNITTTQRQYIRAFGGMSNGFWIGAGEGAAALASAYMQRADIDLMFDPEGPLQFNIFRIHVFPSTNLPSTAPMADIARNSIDRILSGAYRVDWPNMAPSNADFVNHVRRVNEFGGYVVAAPWTPPFPNWKGNNHLYATGENPHLLRGFYRSYAEYLAAWANEMASRGGHLFAISMQNEPTFAANYYGMLWTGAEQATWMAEYGDVITRGNIPGAGGNLDGQRRSNQRVLLMSGTPHQLGYGHGVFHSPALNNAAARENMEIVGYHTYGHWANRYIESIALAHSGTPRRETWMMEKNINATSPGGQLADSTWDLIWPVMNEIHHVIAHNDTSVYTWWYLKRFYSMIGDGTFGTPEGRILPRGYGMGHFSRFLTDTVRLVANLCGAITQGIGPGNQGHLDGAPIGGNNVLQGFPGLPGIRVLAGMRTSNPTTDVEVGRGFGGDLDEHLGGLKRLEDSVSVLIFDDRTNAPGSTHNIRVALPAGFTATSAYGIISSGAGQRHAPLMVVLEADGMGAVVTLPSNAMISLRFRGEWN